MEQAIATYPFEGEQFNIAGFAADTGSVVLNILMRTFQKFISSLQDDGSSQENFQEPEDFAIQLIQQLIMNLQEDDFRKVQKYSLLCVTKTDKAGDEEFQQPIMMANGKFAFSSLAKNPILVNALMSQVLFANFKPVFSKTGLMAVMKGEAISLR